MTSKISRLSAGMGMLSHKLKHQYNPKGGEGQVGRGIICLCLIGSIEYVSTQWLGNQLSLPIEYVSTVDKSVLQ